MLVRRPISILDASILHGLYGRSPNYFESIGTTPPTLQEVSADLALSLSDPRRRLELLFNDVECVGYLDYKLDYPTPFEATVNLLLIPDELRGQGFGREAVAALETTLKGRCTQLQAAVFNHTRSSELFWLRLGYHFARDARPLIRWYAKDLGPLEGAGNTALEDLKPNLTSAGD